MAFLAKHLHPSLAARHHAVRAALVAVGLWAAAVTPLVAKGDETHDRQPPTAPTNVVKQLGQEIGRPGVELQWQAATDNIGISHYEIVREGRLLDKVAKGTQYFDHSSGADVGAWYEVRAVDGAGNMSAAVGAVGPKVPASLVIDDGDSRALFSGPWKHDRDVQAAHWETISYSDAKDASVTVRFEGKRVLWFGKLGADCGKVRVTVDGGPPEIVDTYAADDIWGACIFQKEFTTAGKHVLRVELTGEHSPQSKGHRVYFDGLRAEPGAGATSAREHVESQDGYVIKDGPCWTFGTKVVEAAISLEDGRLVLKSFKNKTSGREMAPAKSLELVSSEVLGIEGQGPWTLERSRTTKLKQGELQLDVTLDRGSISVTQTYVVYPGSSVIRHWRACKNTGATPLVLVEPQFFNFAARLGEGLDSLDFHWMVGAHNEPGCWTLRTEKLTAEKVRRFDSRDPFPPRGGPSPNDAKRPSESYAPWYAMYDRQTKDGLILGWDYLGHWATQFSATDDGTAATAFRLPGHRLTLAPGQTVTMPKAFVGLYREDIDNAGNELLDWQYQYLWDYTREGWFPAINVLANWSKGTFYTDPGSTWFGGQFDIQSQFTKIFRAADLIRYVGGDLYHRDWGWWDRAGDWNGPDFGASGRYLRKSGVGQIIYAYLVYVDRHCTIAEQHRDWLIDYNLDLSKPEVVEHLKWQLDNFHDRWGDFAWRHDATPTIARGNDDTYLLSQDQGFREIITSFLDKYPHSSFQACDGGGYCSGYDYVRYANILQFSDGSIGPLRNYYASLLFPPDKCEDNGDQWKIENYDKARWRALLSMVPVTTGDTWDRSKLEAVRELFDIWHYMAAQGVVGRWVKIYRPQVEGDDPTMYIERLSRDRLRGVVIPARAASGRVTIRPKGLIADHQYLVCFQESKAEAQRTGADLMQSGIVLEKMEPGELIYLNLPMPPGSKRDHEPPTAPTELVVGPGENMGYPGVQLIWTAGSDNNWLSHYEIFRDGQQIDKVAKGTYWFDHSVAADMAAKYEIRSVDGAGNVSPKAAAVSTGARCQVIDDQMNAGKGEVVSYQGTWQREQGLLPAHAETLSSAKEKGESVEFTCEGKRIFLFAKLGDDCGKAEVSVDGARLETIDTYCADDVFGVCVYRKEFATAGRHTVKITVLGEHAPRSKGTWVRIDGVRAELK